MYTLWNDTHPKRTSNGTTAAVGCTPGMSIYYYRRVLYISRFVQSATDACISMHP